MSNPGVSESGVAMDDQFIPLAPRDSYSKVKPGGGSQKKKFLNTQSNLNERRVKKSGGCLSTFQRIVTDPREQLKRLQRAGRFASYDDQQVLSGTMGWEEKLSLLTSTTKIEGRSNALEKQYLRLCGAPDPALVRDPGTLKEALIHVFYKFFGRVRGVVLATPALKVVETVWAHMDDVVTIPAQQGADLMTAYRYAEEQLRAIRQDYVVQGIRNHNLLYVYYVNAIVSLIFGDLGQFNQCQCQMQVLEKELNMQVLDNTLHRILYSIVNGLESDWIKHKAALKSLDMTNDLHPASAKQTCIDLVDKLKRSIDQRNYARALRLSTCNNAVSACPDDFQLSRERLRELLWLKFAIADAKNHGGARLIDSAKVRWNYTQRHIHGIPFLSRAILRTILPQWRMRYLCMIAKSQYYCDVKDICVWLRETSEQSCRQFLVSRQAVFTNSDMNVVDCGKSLHFFTHSTELGTKNKAMG